MNFYHSCKKLDAANVIEVQDLKSLTKQNANIYEFICVVAKRANQIQSNLKEEFIGKKEEFTSYTDSIEEFQENQELIEISKAYERLPNCPNLALKEFLDEDIFYRYSDEEDKTLFS